MSSEPRKNSVFGRCLFCNLGCRLDLEEYAPQRWRPGPRVDGPGPLCARGQMVADLLAHPDRVYRPRGSGREYEYSKVIRELADRWRAASGADGCLEIWLDGNVALEDLAAAHAFCGALGERARLLVHLPPCELGAVEGLDSAGVSQCPPSRWAEADAFLIVGNPLASHPPVASNLMRWGRARGETPTVVIDSVPGVTGSYASQSLICRPGYEYWVVAAIVTAAGLADERGWLPHADVCRQVVIDSGVDLDRVRRAATQLRSARRPAVVIAPQSGSRERWRGLTAAAALWASQRGGSVTVLTGYANALGAARFMGHRGIQDWATGLSASGRAKPGVLLVVGWDPSSAYPRRCWADNGRPGGYVASACAIKPLEADWVDLVTPLAFGFEAAGTYLLAEGPASGVAPVMAPPSGVSSVGKFFADLGKEITGRPVDVSGKAGPMSAAVSEADVATMANLPQIAGPQPPTRDDRPGIEVALTADPLQYGDGHITGRSRWSRMLDLLPELRISVQDSEALGLSDGDVTMVSNEQGQARARIVVTGDRMETVVCYGPSSESVRAAGWGGISGGHPAVRRLAPWRAGLADEAAQAGAIRVEIAPVPCKRIEEADHAHA